MSEIGLSRRSALKAGVGAAAVAIGGGTPFLKVSATLSPRPAS